MLSKQKQSVVECSMLTKDGLVVCLQTSRQSRAELQRLKDIERMSEDGTFDVLPKKEVIELKKEWAKLEKNLGGIKEMKRIPDAIFVVDPKKERICVQEAHTLGIPLDRYLLIQTVIQKN